MANLIPPDAKKAIITEYWIRVVVVWCMLAAAALLVVGVLKFPTLLQIRNAMGVSADAYTDVEEKKQSFESAQEQIVETNTLATLLASQTGQQPFSEVTSTLDQIAGEGVTISSFSYSSNEGVLQTIQIIGVAATPSALLDFSDAIENHPWFNEAALPISNLAKDSDIGFNLSITPSSASSTDE